MQTTSTQTETLDSASDLKHSIEVSVVMPCLNEEETLEVCIKKARGCLEKNGVRGEVVIADNGSTDKSIEIAERCGARVVHVKNKGYGSALMGGFEDAYGKYLLMGDADDSYEFNNLMPFIEKLREGYDVVMGNRFRGGIQPGAMPWHHYWIGNPILTGVLNVFFRTGIGDAHCGLRGLTKDAYRRLNLKTSGMEFASEMVVKSSALGLKMTEVPTTLKPDGRSRPPHLRSFRDGWRHLRFLMLLAPKWMLMYPGAFLGFLGLLLMLLVSKGPVRIGQAELGVHSLVGGALLLIVGYQAVTIGFAARIYAVQEEIGPPSAALQKAFSVFTLERGMIAGGLVLLAGLITIAVLTIQWISSDFGHLEPERTLRPMIIGTTLSVMGVQTVLMSLFYSMLGLERRA